MTESFRTFVVDKTIEYGGDWCINHARRLLKLIDVIGEGMTYQKEVVWLAAHIHDWGFYPAWAVSGVDHALRSKQVASEFLPQHVVVGGYDSSFIDAVLLCIERHHSPGPDLPIEAQLLCDADAVDFLGATGTLRDFSRKPSDLRGAYNTVFGRMAKLPGQLQFDVSKRLASERILRASEFLKAFVEETGDFF